MNAIASEVSDVNRKLMKVLMTVEALENALLTESSNNNTILQKLHGYEQTMNEGS